MIADTVRLALDAGAPGPLGATPTAGGLDLALASRHAERVEVVFFAPDATTEIARADLPERTGDVWHGRAPGFGAGAIYGFRVHGPWATHDGHRFDASKLLLDPFAKALAGRFVWSDRHHSRPPPDRPDGPPAFVDNAATAWKAVAVDPQALAPLPVGPRIPWSRTIVHELNVRGFTMRMDALSDAERGRFKGLGSTQALSYLKALGVTALELLPVHAFLNDRFLHDKGLRNFWGYNTLSYFAPHPAYGGAEVNAEMRAFVEAAHDAGLEVILDVVYNHTCEGDHRGPTISWRGIDNATYYRLRPEDRSRYADITGCGATLDASEPIVRTMIRESLAHFAGAYGIDGYRFDLATQLGVGPDGRFDRHAPMFSEIAADRRLSHLKLIAEPWDAGAHFEVGGFPDDWSEWNAHARDSIRRFWRGDPGETAAFATRLSGSPDVYKARGRPVRAGVTYAACHDGFTAMDLVSYAKKRNHANLEDNRDGSDHDGSWNCGHEGPTDDPAILALRERQWRNLLASALLGFGTPMLLAGDEFGRTQNGNNNAWNQDDETSWLDWELAESPQGRARIAFVKRVIALRRRVHDALPDGFPVHEGAHEGGPVVSWHGEDGHPMRADAWERTQTFGLWIRASDWLLVVNGGGCDRAFRLPVGSGRWSGALDTADPQRPEGASLAAGGQSVDMAAHSLRLMKRVGAGGAEGGGRGY